MQRVHPSKAPSTNLAGVHAQPNQCVQLGGPLLSICQPELAQVQKIYPLNSNTPITDAQVTQILDAAKSMNLPTTRCCQAAQKFDQGRCSCDTSLPPLLANVGLQVSSVGLQSGRSCSLFTAWRWIP